MARGRAIMGPSDSRKGVALVLKVARRGLQNTVPLGDVPPPPRVVSRYSGEMYGHKGRLEAILRGKAAIPQWGFTAGAPYPVESPRWGGNSRG